MRLCFLIEDQYRHDSMPLDVVRRLVSWGHDIDVVEPGRSLVALDELLGRGHDAWVLKTVSGGPGLSLFEAAAAAGITTINDARAVRAVRDKTIAAAVARRHALPCPETGFAATPEVLARLGAERFPLVVKPVGGNSGRAVRLVHCARELAVAQEALRGEGFLLVQPYVVNSGVDYKVYSLGGEIHATVRASPLHPERAVRQREVPLPDDLARVVARVGEAYGLDLFGVDVVEGPAGWTVVDVNDFPSFRAVPDAVTRVAKTVLRLAAGPVIPEQGASHGLARVSA
ncbi:hypothetical protein OG216_35310 [Streptomycetaceae bacterium NBC_01309]